MRFLLKFILSKKATNIDEIFTDNLTICSKCLIEGENFLSLCGLLRKHKLYDGYLFSGNMYLIYPLLLAKWDKFQILSLKTKSSFHFKYQYIHLRLCPKTQTFLKMTFWMLDRYEKKKNRYWKNMSFRSICLGSSIFCSYKY